jgi:Zn-dependent membrane protease YugP
MPFGFFDPTYLLLLPAMAFAMWAQHKVMAASIMSRNGVDDVRVEAVGGVLSDHYDPRVKVVRLSADNYGGRSIASIAVAAHEVGHVLQHHQRWLPLALRSQIAPVAGFGSTLAMPLFIVGLFFGRGMPWGTWLMDAGIVFFAAAVLFHLVTLPVEFDASNRALAQLTSSGSLMPQEVAGAKKVLDAAALTYVAAAAMAALQLVRLLLIRNSRR